MTLIYEINPISNSKLAIWDFADGQHTRGRLLSIPNTTLHLPPHHTPTWSRSPLSFSPPCSPSAPRRPPRTPAAPSSTSSSGHGLTSRPSARLSSGPRATTQCRYGRLYGVGRRAVVCMCVWGGGRREMKRGVGNVAVVRNHSTRA